MMIVAKRGTTAKMSLKWALRSRLSTAASPNSTLERLLVCAPTAPTTSTTMMARRSSV